MHGRRFSNFQTLHERIFSCSRERRSLKKGAVPNNPILKKDYCSVTSFSNASTCIYFRVWLEDVYCNEWSDSRQIAKTDTKNKKEGAKKRKERETNERKEIWKKERTKEKKKEWKERRSQGRGRERARLCDRYLVTTRSRTDRHRINRQNLRSRYSMSLTNPNQEKQNWSRNTSRRERQ